jgi:hypothetical protein
MISERDISEKFSVIWKQNFPLLTSNFIRVFNNTQIEIINKNQINSIDGVRYDLISEAGFNLAEIAVKNKMVINDFLSVNENVTALITSTAKSIWKSGKYLSEDLEISNLEKDQMIKIANNILEFIDNLNGNAVLFKPKLKGYGFIPDLEGDLLIDDTLYELKTVNRNFKSSDLKQLFIYLALKQVSSKSCWKYGGLYNPRKGVYCKFNVKNLIYNLSGGDTPNEVFENLLNGLIRDIEIDSKF